MKEVETAPSIRELTDAELDNVSGGDVLFTSGAAGLVETAKAATADGNGFQGIHYHYNNHGEMVSVSYEHAAHLGLPVP